MKGSPLIKNYMPELDGLRAIAVLAVIVFHVFPLGLSGGFLGVDIFFVLSGYLITSLLMQERAAHGNFSLRNFYVRRCLRLLPALTWLIFIFLLVSYCFSEIFGSFPDRLKEAFLSLTYVTNWARAFDLYPPNPFLGHTWSLAIEEQFYILWPIILTGLLALSSRGSRCLPLAIVMGIVIICAWRIMLIMDGAAIDRVYNGLDTRADALMWGALVAILPLRLWSERAGTLFILLSSLAAVLLLVYFFIYSNWESREHYIWKLPLLYFSMALLIGLVASGVTSAFFLQISPLVFTGRISYGLYLWHVPILIVLLKTGFAGTRLLLLVLVLSYIFATFSWFVIERPALRLRVRYQR